MSGIAALLDSNVLVAAVVEPHAHYPDSSALFDAQGRVRFAVAAHSLAEAYNTLTRGRLPGAFLSPAEALAATDWLRAATALVGLTPPQTVDAIRSFAAGGGVGPVVYDRLIGEVAVLHGIPAIVTWNIRHLAGLFPRLRVVTPTEFLAGSVASP